MLDGRISSCLTTLLVHLPSCDQTRPGSDQGLGQGLGGPQSAMTEQRVGSRVQRQAGHRPLHIHQKKTAMTGGHARSARAAGAYLGQTEENTLGKSGSGLDVKQMACARRDRTDVTGAGEHTVRPRKPQVAGKTRAKTKSKATG